MRITGDWLTHPGTQSVLSLLTCAGHQAFAVGGCVRNALLGVAVADVDVATSATPPEVIALAQDAGLRVVPTGIDHGTVTVVAHGTGYEVTTFRADIDTDGRHARVQFSTHVTDDAERRDFTMNALYAQADGTVVDPLGGLPDVQARRLRFINDAGQRIREDYLRILRFFRFSAWYGDPDTGFDAEALDAIARNLDGLDRLSVERVTAELLKLLAAVDPGPAVAVMAQVGVLMRLLPGASPKMLGPLVHLEQSFGIAPDALRRLVTLCPVGDPPLRLSKAQARRVAMLQDGLAISDGPGALGYRMGFEGARDTLVLRAAMLEQPLEADALTAAQSGAQAQFPVAAADLMPGLEGAALGQRLSELEARWIASGFALTREGLLGRPD